MAKTLEQHAKAIAEGDRSALEALVLEIQDEIYGLSLRILGVPADAQDATRKS